MTAKMTIRMDDQLKADMTATLDAIGINTTTFFIMAAKQLVARQALPFEARASQSTFMSPAMEKLLIEEFAKINGTIADDSIIVTEDYKQKIKGMYGA
ncbi:MAG: type II toxin-antitoxin system RelB/DinJ family antitoxin [Lactobacillaceae bacterium]|jgi:addiction module RelB/DinJ family antitoxin|nr:type II toxin-antitoxin system RelB/DinJ family antitoxin [Lactobacillaceae bacterium]